MKTKRLISQAILLLITNVVFSQQINVTSWTDLRNMQNPCDSITINVGGDMDATYAQGPITVNIVGNTINIDIVKIYGFATQPVSPNIDWDVDVNLGYLPKGAYTINIAGKLSTVLYGFMTDTFSINHDFQFLKDTSFCFGDSVKIGGNIPGINSASYLWNNGKTSKNIFASDSGQYFVTATGSNCTVSDTAYVSMSAEIPGILGQDSTICMGDSLILGGGPSYYSYLWSDNRITPSTTWYFPTTDSVSISLEVTDSIACTSHQEINFKVIDCDTVANGFLEIIDNASLTIYPNPSSSFFTIESVDPIQRLIIRNANGKVIFEIQNIDSNKFINSQQFSNGLYIIEIEGTYTRNYKKLLIAN